MPTKDKRRQSKAAKAETATATKTRSQLRNSVVRFYDVMEEEVGADELYGFSVATKTARFDAWHMEYSLWALRNGEKIMEPQSVRKMLERARLAQCGMSSATVSPDGTVTYEISRIIKFSMGVAGYV
jgi:hypothetical protein